MPASNPLAHRRLLVTRPKHQGRSLCDAIAAAGGEAFAFPSLAIQDITPSTECLSYFAALDSFNFIIFISPNAVNYCLQKLNAEQCNALANLTLAAIGNSTAVTLAGYKLKTSLVPDVANSESLLALAPLQQVHGQRILIVRGQGGNTLLADTLTERGAQVCHAVVYQRSLPRQSMEPHLPDWQTHGLDAIISTSQESLRNLLQLTPDADKAWLLQQQLLVISPAMLELTRTCGFTKTPYLAEGASDAAILHCLIHHLGRES